MVGIFGGLQLLYIDGYDEVFMIFIEGFVKVVIVMQNIFKYEVGLCDVIDLFGGLYYVEMLIDQMEVEILWVIVEIDEQGGMFKVVENGFVQKVIGESVLGF